MRKINDGLTRYQRYYKKHPEKRAAWRAAYLARHGEEAIRAKRQAEYRKDPARLYFNNVKHHYGVERELYEEMLASQNAKCAICEVDLLSLKRRPSVDHDHETGKVRALLCGPCNVKVGVIEHSLYPKLIAYLERYGVRKVS